MSKTTPLKEAKIRFRQSRGNLKRKAEGKINSLMRGSEYKVSAKTPGLQFPLGNHDTRIATRTSLLRKCRRSDKRKSKSVRRKSKKINEDEEEEEEENSGSRPKNQKAIEVM